MPNRGTDRRIGLNVQYLAPHMKQLKNKNDSAMLVRGEDNYGHFDKDVAALTDLDPVAVEAHAALQNRYVAISSAKEAS